MRADLDAFLEHLEHEVRASKNTLRAYRRDIEVFIDGVETRRKREAKIGDLSLREVRRHLAALHATGLDFVRNLGARQFTRSVVAQGGTLFADAIGDLNGDGRSDALLAFDDDVQVRAYLASGTGFLTDVAAELGFQPVLGEGTSSMVLNCFSISLMPSVSR